MTIHQGSFQQQTVQVAEARGAFNDARVLEAREPKFRPNRLRRGYREFLSVCGLTTAQMANLEHCYRRAAFRLQ